MPIVPTPQRRALAWALVVLWVLGFEIGPNVHLGLHGVLAPHTHGEKLAHDDHEHEHGHDAEHGHDLGAADHHDHHDDHADADSHESPVPGPESAAHDGADDAMAGASASRVDPAHGDHDLMHRGIAVVAPPIATPAVAQIPFVVVVPPRALTERPDSRLFARPRARGPPVGVV